MTQAKAATVASALITAGFFARTALASDGTWVVYAGASVNGLTPINTVKTFQDAQSITGNVAEVIFT